MAEKEKKPKILCVDDEAGNLALMETIFVPRGYETMLAENGQVALEKTAADLPDLILLDITMPKMSGYEVLKRLRADEGTRLIPVVMVTALKDTEDRIKSLEAGCDDFISKPFDMTELLTRVKSLLKISYYRRQLDEREKFKAVIDQMSDGIAICSPDWLIKDTNASLLKYLNIVYPATVNLVETIFRNYSVSIPKEALMDLSIAYKAFDLLREETTATKPLYLAATLDAVKNPAGELSSIIFTVRDVTQARREESLKQSFLGLISHKLRTPLVVINGGVSLLHEGLCDPLTCKQKKTVDAIADKAYVLTSLIEKLLGFTMISGQKFDEGKEIMDIHSELSAFTNLIVKNSKNKKIELSIDCQAGTKIEMSKIYFEQIIGNLVQNAIKFNDKDIIKISIVVKKMPDKIEISVIDNGPGIPNEEYERIFEIFYQVEKYFTGQIEGAGLGLAIVKRVVEGLGGKVQVKSELGRGADFIISLPVDHGAVDTRIP